ncbi:MAG: glycoside hydrolase family 3 C-terminal domain-containing protein, partial [Oscillospiraceae bacterium]|nr:glycoside hydrolase family 3 C-terminal domain-containing protein [Oscillospiraceae bacterium]
RYDALWDQEKKSFVAAMQKKLRRFNTAMLAELMAAEYRYPYGDAIRKEDIAGEAEICIYVIARQSGEGKDRRTEDYCISGAEKAHLQVCSENYKAIVLIVNTGSSFDLSFLKEFPKIKAVLYACQLGQEGGLAVADVLTGRVNPSGRLATTWTKDYADIPFSEEYSYRGKDLNDAQYKEGIYVGYRYYDSFGVEPRYAFGYGLSYTDFSRGLKEVLLDGTQVDVSVLIRNSGKFSGKEVVQLYASCPAGKLEKEYQSLVAFAKTRRLDPGEEETLKLHFDMTSLASYDEETASYILEKGDYVLRTGNSSRNTEVVSVLELPETVTVSVHRNLCAAKNPVQVLHHVQKEIVISGERITLDPSSFHMVESDYEDLVPYEDVRVTDVLRKLSVEEKTHLCAGIGLLGGKTAFTLPGSVGNTTSEFTALGVPNATFCDGPAGLRIQRRSTVDKKGGVKPVDGAMSIYSYLPNVLQKALYGDPEKDTVIYQFVTSFPVETVAAQTWNLDLIQCVGRAVSEEMKEYGVVFWLAPAMNIIRNPLCGRNYEYYSEDPFLTGKMAAAVIKGVQSIQGNYVTVKHFAANNQEENRYYVSSNMDERTLREIYLRGFEIAVKEAAPKAIMTAYNKINGVYCSENIELLCDILRKEWRFDGLVMTDWLSTGEDRAQNPDCIANGTDLIMPGGKGVWKELAKANKAGKLSIEAIERAANNVLKCVLNSNISI